jgi:hypothetical protein
MVGQLAAEIPNHRHRRLLRTPHERPRHKRAADQRDELSSFQPTEMHPLPLAREEA